LKQRRIDKGFEGLALSPDGHTAYAVVEAPLGSEGVTGSSRADRVIRIDAFDDPTTATVGGHFVVVHSPVTAYSATDPQPKVAYHAATWISATKILLLEQDAGLMRLLVADFAGATNLVGQPAKGETSLTPENASNLAALTAILTPAVTTE